MRRSRKLSDRRTPVIGRLVGRVSPAMLAALLAVSLVGSSPPVRAVAADPTLSPAGETMRYLCVQYGGRQIDVIDAADDGGFTPLAGNAAAAINRFGIQAPVARQRKFGDVTVTLVTGLASGEIVSNPGSPFKGKQVDLCLVMVAKALPDAPAETARWIGVPVADDSDPKHVLFGYVDTPGGRKDASTLDDAALNAAVDRGEMRILDVSVSPNLTVYSLAAPRPTVAAAVRGPTPVDPAAEPVTTPFDDFKSLCIDRKGVIADSLAAADKTGWMQVPEADAEEPPFPMTAASVRLKSTDDDFEILFAGQARMLVGLQELKMDLCTIVQAPPNDTALIKAVEDWIALPPTEIAPDGSRTYIFTEDATSHTPIPAKGFEAALTRKFKAGKVSIVIIERSGYMDRASMVSYGVLTRVINSDASPGGPGPLAR